MTDPFSSTLGKYFDKVDRVMTQVDRITEDIAHMPVAAFIFRDKESDDVKFSTDIRYNSCKVKYNYICPRQWPKKSYSLFVLGKLV